MKIQCRLDYFLLPKSMQNLILDCRIHSAYCYLKRKKKEAVALAFGNLITLYWLTKNIPPLYRKKYHSLQQNTKSSKTEVYFGK